MAEHKEYWSANETDGTIKISEEVVASIAAIAAADTDGVGGLCSSLTSDIVSFLSKKNIAKGVRVELHEGDTVSVALNVLAEFGHNICDMAKAVQENVKSAILSMTGLTPVSIDVQVSGVTFAQQETSAAPAEQTTTEEDK